MDDSRRVQLIRKGNELYNSGDLETAKRCFITAQYTDGLIRIADHYNSEGRFIEAIFLYRRAGCTEKLQELYACAAAVIRELMQQDRDSGPSVAASPGENLLSLLRDREDRNGR